jgi:hypothetical protein
MSQALTTRDQAVNMEQVLVNGDLSKLSAPERLHFYQAVCESIGLNPLTQPFAYIVLNGKMVLYAKKDATDQIRSNRHISVTIASRERHDDVYVVTARATTPDGRTDESIGAVSISGLKGESLANAFMKAETKAKRRVTLSIGGLGWLDETEVQSVADARPANVNTVTGEIIEADAVRERQAPRAAMPTEVELVPSLDGMPDHIDAEVITIEEEPRPASLFYQRYSELVAKARTILPGDVLETLPLGLAPSAQQADVVIAGKRLREVLDSHAAGVK